MKNHFLSRFDADNLRKAVIYFVIAVSLIIISLFLGIEKIPVWGFLCFFSELPSFFMHCCVLGEMQNIMELCVLIIILITLSD